MNIKNLLTQGFDNIQIRFTEQDDIYFTSDTHFYHSNIIQFCNRPYATVEEMNNALIENWNNKVTSKDAIVFHLGDFAFAGSKQISDILDKLNGKIYLIIGNHDEKTIQSSLLHRFHYVTNQMKIRVGHQSIYLNHYPFLCYGGAYRGVWQLFGHVHSGPLSTSGKDNNRLSNLFPLQYDVGVDNNNYAPISYLEVKEKINKQLERAYGTELSTVEG